MIDFDRKPSPKSENEKSFDALNKRYTEKFGKPYVFDFAAEPMTWEEALADIKRRIADGNPQPEPDYKKGVDY
jgi:2-oxo-4-hydroxy-4-carboxy--5-ureidoimidazoline (OHCU) decarboxylase